MNDTAPLLFVPGETGSSGRVFLSLLVEASQPFHHELHLVHLDRAELRGLPVRDDERPLLPAQHLVEGKLPERLPSSAWRIRPFSNQIFPSLPFPVTRTQAVFR